MKMSQQSEGEVLFCRDARLKGTPPPAVLLSRIHLHSGNISAQHTQHTHTTVFASINRTRRLPTTSRRWNPEATRRLCGSGEQMQLWLQKSPAGVPVDAAPPQPLPTHTHWDLSSQHWSGLLRLKTVLTFLCAFFGASGGFPQTQQTGWTQTPDPDLGEATPFVCLLVQTA